MVCQKCGNPIEQGNRFCSKCGALQPQPVQSFGMENPIIASLKALGSSPIFLAAVISYTLLILASFARSLMPMGSAYKIMQLLDLEHLYYYIDFDVVTGVTAVFSFIALIPSMVPALGMWLTFAAAKGKTYTEFKTTGLTIIKILTIIKLIGVCLAAGIVMIVCVIAIIAILIQGESAALLAAPLVFILVMAVFAVAVVYYVKVLQTVNAIKSTAMTGVPNEKASRFVAVCCFVLAGISAVSIIPLLIKAILLFGIANTVASVFSAMLSTVMYICFGLIIFKYRKTIKGFK